MAGVGTAVKLGVTAVKNKDEIKKILLSAGIGIFLPFFLIVVSIFSLITALLPEGVLPDSNTVNVTETRIYQSMKPVMESHYEEIKKEMEEKKQKLIERNTVEETITDENGNQKTIRKCNLTINKTVSHEALTYVIAYLECSGKIEKKTGKIKEKDAEEFLRAVVKIKTKKVKEKEYDIYSTYLKPEKIAKKYFKTEEEKSRYRACCGAYGTYFGKEEAEIDIETIDINEILDMNVNLLEIPLYLQYEQPWGSMSYGTGTIAQKGCAPTCLAMVLSYLKQQNIYPNTITSWTGNRYYVAGAGSSWSIFPAVAEHWDVSCTNLGKNTQSMVEKLKKGNPVIASMGPGTFTKGGHFIVLTGITESGKIKVNDPSDNAIKKHKDKEFEISLIMRESKNYWSFSM